MFCLWVCGPCFKHSDIILVDRRSKLDSSKLNFFVTVCKYLYWCRCFMHDFKPIRGNVLETFSILCYGFGLMLYGSGSGRIRIRVLVVEYFMIYKKYNGFPWEWLELVDWCRGKPWTGCTGGIDPARTSCK